MSEQKGYAQSIVEGHLCGPVELRVGLNELLGSAGSNELLGRVGTNELLGSAGSNELLGSAGSNELLGSAGSNELLGNTIPLVPMSSGNSIACICLKD
ncbi:MAG: hypothetical protein IJ125_03235 [Atopobiaceae bacterium]|nr:hypothetical protein [Atopobiaceae bacterium]